MNDKEKAVEKGSKVTICNLNLRKYGEENQTRNGIGVGKNQMP